MESLIQNLHIQQNKEFGRSLLEKLNRTYSKFLGFINQV